MVRGLRTLRQIARTLTTRVKAARDRNDDALAADLIAVLHKLGQANRAPDVPLLVDLVGKAIEKKARELAPAKGVGQEIP